MSRFFITGRGGANFYLILIYNEKATVIVSFSNLLMFSRCYTLLVFVIIGH